MNKVSVEVFVPSIGKKYDFLLPNAMSINDASELIHKAICDFEGLMYTSREIPQLCSVESEKIINGVLTVESAGIRDGCRLVLV